MVDLIAYIADYEYARAQCMPELVLYQLQMPLKLKNHRKHYQ